MQTSNDNRLLIAVATKNGHAVDLHFGHARTFHVYEVDGQHVSFVGVRDADQYCKGDESTEETREQTLDRIAHCLRDVSALLVAKVGDSPKEHLAKSGLPVLSDYAHTSVEEAALAWWKTIRS